VVELLFPHWNLQVRRNVLLLPKGLIKLRLSIPGGQAGRADPGACGLKNEVILY